MKHHYFLLHFLQLVAATPLADSSCKTMPGDSSWPSPDEWTKALPGVTPRGPQDANVPRPDYQLTVTSPAQVQAAVKFAAEKNIRLTILNSGHDFLGRNDAPSGLSLMITNLKGIRVHESFEVTANGAPDVNYTADPARDVNVIKPVKGKQAAVTFGAGYGGQQLNNALAKSGLFVMAAAASRPAPAGGYGQTAGHAPFSSKYGLAADNVLEYKVVTADGKLRIANALSEPDLFWALRGGGGGTYGVVVEATVKAHPSPKITMTRWWLKTSNPNDTTSIYDPAAYILSQMPTINDNAGSQGYFYIYPNEIWAMLLTADDQSGIEISNKTWEPVLSKAASFPGMNKAIHQYSEIPNFKSWFDIIFGSIDTPASTTAGSEAGRILEEAYGSGVTSLDSRLLGQKHLTDPKLATALRDSMPQGQGRMLRGHLIGGGQVLKGGAETSVHPSWRKTYIHLIGTTYDTPDVKALKDLAPDMGCYANECLWNEKNYKELMWGANYKRLYEIKTKYDPTGLFWVSPGVGADDFAFDPKTNRVCRTTKNTEANSQSLGIPPLFDNQRKGAHDSGSYRTGPESQEAADKESAAKAAPKGPPEPTKGKGTSKGTST